MDKPVINEVVRTGHDDSMARKFRKTIKGKRHLAGDDSRSKPDPTKRVVPRLGRKSNNNKPKRKKLIIDTQKVGRTHKEAVEFILANQDKPIVIEMVKQVKDKLALQSVVSRMVAYHLGGWDVSNNSITNGSIIADSKSWDVKDGLLYSKVTGQRPNQFEWLYSLRTALESTIVEDIDTIKSKINGRPKI